MTLLLAVSAAFVASVLFAGWLLRRSYANQPKRPLTIAEELVRDRALNDKHRAWPVDRDGRAHKVERKVVLKARSHT